MNPQKRKIAVASLSVVSNSTLVIFKLMVGIMTGAVSIISEAIHSGIDLLAALIALFSVRTASKPADEDHPFGHGKVENISGTIEALLIFIAAGWIIYEAVDKFRHPQPIEMIGWGIAIMLISSAVNLIVSHYLFKVGRETDSIALQADAWHLRTDVYTSAGVMGSLLIIWAGGLFVPAAGLHWIDPAAAFVVALLIIRAAYRLTIHSARDLMDAPLPSEEERIIKGLIADMYPDIHGFHKLRTRKAGSNRFIEFHIKVDPTMTVEESHNLAHRVNDIIETHFNGSHVTIHTEPCDGHCDRECISGCLLTEKQRAEIRKKPR